MEIHKPLLEMEMITQNLRVQAGDTNRRPRGGVIIATDFDHLGLYHVLHDGGTAVWGN